MVSGYVNFFLQWECLFVPAVIVFLTAFLLVNWLRNSYANQNKKLKKITNKLISYPTQADTAMRNAPYCYKVQWHIYKRTNVDKPSLVFEFYKHDFVVKGVALAVIPTVISIFYFVVFCFAPTHNKYLFLLAFNALFVVTVVLVAMVFFVNRTRKAQRVFAQFLLELNKSIPTPPEPVFNTVERLNSLQQLEPTPNVMQRAAQILQQRGINSKRTVEEQRKINLALNGLLNAYAGKLTNQ